ncbi:MAG: hypothetical protein ABSD57_03415 [Verrucomicrobiota bacterium]|jgi:hypothetical protein
MDYAETKELATRLGLRFDPAQNYVLADDYGFLHHLAQGENRYAFNVLSGRHRQNEVLAFDYHYEIPAKGSNREASSSHCYLTTAIVLMPAYFPELRIAPEGLLSKIAEAFGEEDIHFESAEFTRAFRVWSKDKRFAYDICNPQVIDYLLENRDLNIQIQNCTLALVSDTQWPAKQVENNLERLSEIRSRLPEYLFTKT